MIENQRSKQSKYTEPSRNCDIVMKGGITGGVVYPQAVSELAETFRFRNIGGTSAGAIAAAAAAAAEHGRGSGGFEKLSELPDWIGADRNLLSLFQPQCSTCGLFRILTTKIEHGWLRAIAIAIFLHVPMVVLGVVPAAVLAILADPGSSIWLHVVVVVAVFVLAALGAVVALVAYLVGKLLWAVPATALGCARVGPRLSRRMNPGRRRSPPGCTDGSTSTRAWATVSHSPSAISGPGRRATRRARPRTRTSATSTWR